MRKVKNKEIYKIKLILTNNCILRCRYCFIKKDKKTMDYFTAKKAIKFLISSRGKEKMLLIYGGEPLLYFNLLQKIILFARKEAQKNKKNLIISLATNGILLTKEYLEFFRKEQVKLALSLDGDKSTHDAYRKFRNGKGSFQKVFEKLSLVFKNLEKRNICNLFGVHPAYVNKMYENFLYLNSLGFENINIEPIRIYGWSEEKKRIFFQNLLKILNYISKKIEKDENIYLNSINRAIKSIEDLNYFKKKLCPFYYSLEIFPDGTMSFSPFAKNKNGIGNINNKIAERYKNCKFDLDDERCKYCWHEYLRVNKLSEDNFVMKIRDAYSLEIAKRFLKLKESNQKFRKYVMEAKLKIFE